MPSMTRLPYGTAGFRAEASLLDGVAEKVGEFAVWLSRKAGGQAVGIMVTASHNPVGDNGIKLIMPNGEMMPEEYEGILEAFANGEPMSLEESGGAVVAIARDTRPSGLHLTELVQQAVEKQRDAKCLDWGLCTTPEAHSFVKRYNESGQPLKVLRQAYLDAFPRNVNIAIDCANGVGALPLRCLKGNLINTGEGILNEACGADWVKTKNCLPSGFESYHGLAASLDGDADRVIFFVSQPFQMLDGDRIACLFAKLLKTFAPPHLHIGVVQTAYANGASTDYLRSLGIPVECTPTGVKHLHRAAHHFQIGIYFEANGHGTVLFKPEIVGQLSPELKAWALLFNPCVGDGIADLYAVLRALELLQWTPQQWMQLYQEYPNVLRKVPVPRRGMITTVDADRKVISPAGLQARIDEAVARFKGGRSFVRASGTENVVRVYAEVSEGSADDLADLVEQIVRSELQ